MSNGGEEPKSWAQDFVKLKCQEDSLEEAELEPRNRPEVKTRQTSAQR